MGRQISSRQVTSASLVLIALLVLASTILYSYLRIGETSVSPTGTYTGQMGVSFQGRYHYLTAVPICRHNFLPCSTPDEVVFYLETNTTVTRLIFYCGVVPYFCTRADQLPFSDGALIYVKGTLMQPSKWPTDQFEPSLHFNGELYVFHYDIIS